MLELEEKVERLQSDDKQKQISDLLRVVDELKKENVRLQVIVDKIRGLVNGSGSSCGMLLSSILNLELTSRSKYRRRLSQRKSLTTLGGQPTASNPASKPKQ